MLPANYSPMANLRNLINFKFQICIQLTQYITLPIEMDKISYLQKENKQLRVQLQEIKQIMKLRKLEIDILSSQVQRTNSKRLMDVIISYRERQDKLQTSIAEFKKEISQLATDNLVLRQLNDSQNMEMKNSEALNLASIELLNKKIAELQQKIFQLEKSAKEYDKISGFVLRNRDIFSPQQMAMQLKSKEYEWEDQINEMKAQQSQCKKNEQDLLVVNTVLRNKIVSLQAQLAMPNRNLGEVLDKSLKKLMLYFIEVQKKIITGDEDSDSDQENNDIQLIAPELSGVFPQKQLRIQKDYGVPHIDLLKVRQSMVNTSKKVEEHLRARNHLNDKEKLQRLEIQLEYSRRQLSKNIIDLRQEKNRRKRAESFIIELESRIDLLVASNQHLEKKVRKYWQKLKSEREKMYGVNQNLDTGKGIIDDQPVHTLDQTLRLIQPRRREPTQDIQNQPHVANPSTLLNERNIDYKIHLQILAKELERNKRLQNLNQKKKYHMDEYVQNLNKEKQEEKQKQVKKIKRSTSNPLLYFNQRRRDIMEVHEQNGNAVLDERQRLEQTLYNPGQGGIGFQQVLLHLDDGYDNDQ